MIITIDAMGCQKKICEKIKEKKADYVLSLKGNQSATHEAVKDFFSMDEKTLAKCGVVKSEKECNPDHGRIENRQYYMCTNMSWLEKKDEWTGLKAVVMAREERTVNGKTSTDVRFFLTSLENLNLVKKSIRKHWGIENRLHWYLDMTFNENEKSLAQTRRACLERTVCSSYRLTAVRQVASRTDRKSKGNSPL